MQRTSLDRWNGYPGKFLREGGWVLLLAGCIFFGRLDYPLLEPDEGRYAELPRLMLERGEYLVPKLGGKPYNDKPPLVYWSIAAAFALFGEGHVAARLVPALASWLTIVAVYLWTRRWLGSATAIWSCLILCSMVGFVGFGRMLLLDGVLTLFVVTAFLSGLHAVQGGTLARGWWLTSAVLMGLGFMAKGPVAVVLVAPLLATYRWIDPTSARWRWWDGLLYAGLVGLIALPWHVWMLFAVDSFGPEFIWRHHVMRFLRPYHHAKPLWYFVPALLLECMPWTGLLPLAVWRFRQAPAAVKVCGLAALWCFVFFSLSRAKLPTYILPMLPLTAIVLGHALQVMIGQIQHERRWAWACAGGIVTLAAVVGLRGDVVAHLLNHEPHPLDYLALAMVPAAGILAARRRTNRGTWVGLGTLAVLATTMVAWHTIPHFAEEASRGVVSSRLASVARARGLPTVAYRGSWEASSFYINAGELPVFHLEDRERLIDYLRGQREALILVRPNEGRLEELLATIPAEFDVAHVHFDPRVCGVYVHPYLDRPPTVPHPEWATQSAHAILGP